MHYAPHDRPKVWKSAGSLGLVPNLNAAHTAGRGTFDRRAASGSASSPSATNMWIDVLAVAVSAEDVEPNNLH